jgi:hypothetical protein
MRILAVAALALVMLALPAQAQMAGKRPSGDGQKAATKSGPVIDEKAYKAALDRIPDSKEKVDPWGQMRPSEPRKK